MLPDDIVGARTAQSFWFWRTWRTSRLRQVALEQEGLRALYRFEVDLKCH